MLTELSRASITNLCRTMLKTLRNSDYELVLGGRYLILSELKSAGKRISSAEKYQLPLVGLLYRFLQLYEFNIDEEKLRLFLRENRADDEDIDNIYAYITVCCCVRLCEEKDGVSLLRSARNFDYGKLREDCSALEGRLRLYKDYEISDSTTRGIYRERLYRLAKKRNTEPITLLSNIPQSKFSDVLLSRPQEYRLRYFSVLFMLFAAFFSLSALCGMNTIAILLCIIPLYEVAKIFTDFIFRGIFKARPALRIKTEQIPKTLAVITTLLDSGADGAVEKLEKYYLCNVSDNLYLGILADLPDSKTADDSADAAVIQRLNGKIELLNRKYKNRFFLFYRERRYSISEKAYIAPERKRGAVCELVKQLYTGDSALIISGGGDLDGIKYLITLDCDTRLTPGSVKNMVSSAMHPYNRAVIDKKRGIVTKGHGIFQPCISPELPSALKSPFSYFFSAQPSGAYVQAGFDVYDSVFGTSNFCGKGLIDVEAFYTCVCGVFPKESILSHDIAEGCRLRCGFISDVTLLDKEPSNAISYYRRFHRWVRGDVQSLILLGSKTRDETGQKRKNPLTAFDKYRLCDAVRSALVPVFAVVCIAYSLFFHSFAGVGLFFSLLYLLLPVFFRFCGDIVFFSFHPGRRFQSLEATDLRKEVITAVLKMSFLFFEAQTALSAIITAAVRMFSRRKLLKWTTAATADLTPSEPFSYFFGFLPSSLFGMFAMLLSGTVGVGIFGILTAVSPLSAYLASKPYTDGKKAEKNSEKLIGWVTDSYKYFQDFVTAEHSYLPPDNFQVTADVGIAPRTSPTNIGLYLLSTVAVCDLGIIPPQKLYDRLEPTLRTLCRLPKYNGKLYNWYDTRTCAVISGFVSTVDCGNYLASLITLSAALEEYIRYDTRLLECKRLCDQLAAECDLSELYCKQRNLFYIGSGFGAENCYDLYESEMMITDITAVACNYAPAEHIGALGVPVIGKKGRIGAASWGGTAFEFFMPLLFLPAPKGTICYEAMKFAYRQQQSKRAQLGNKSVSGSSESCYFEFDSRMNYQYKAHGVESLSVQSGIDSEVVLSPYSSFLMLAASDKPLSELDAFYTEGVYGKYGFYEAVDFTKSRVGDGYAVIKCFMAHHIGMSIIAAANYRLDSVFVKRFCSVPKISAVLPLLYRKIPTDAPIEPKRQVKLPQVPYRIPDAEFTQKASVISNTSMLMLCCNEGINVFCLGSCICKKDPRKLHGLTLLYNGSRVRNLLDYPKKFSDNSAEYSSEGAGAVITVMPDCRALIIETEGTTGGSALIFEPVMYPLTEYERHVAYAKLFVTSHAEDGILYFEKNKEKAFVIGVAVIGDRKPSFACRAEQILPYCDKEDELMNTEPEYKSGACVNPFALIKTALENCVYVIAAGRSTDEVKSVIQRLKKEKINAKACKNALCTLLNSSLFPLPPPQPLYSEVINTLMCPPPSQSVSSAGVCSVETLYKFGISGDEPILCIDARGEHGIQQSRVLLPSYIAVHKAALISGISYDTVILYDSDDGYYKKGENELRRAVSSCGASAMLNQRGGVFIVNADKTTAGCVYDYSFYIVNAVTKSKTKPYVPPMHRLQKRPDKVSSQRARIEKDCIVLPYRNSPVPRSYIYANPDFGTVVTDRSLGFSFYENSRLNLISAHNTDTDISSENVIFTVGSISYDICACACEVRYHTSYAEYLGYAGKDAVRLTAAVDPELPYKRIAVSVGCGGLLCLRIDMKSGVNDKKAVSRSGLIFIRNTHRKDAYDIFVYCRESKRAEFDGRFVNVYVDAPTGGEYTFLLGVCQSKENLDRILAVYPESAKRYREVLNEYLLPFQLYTSNDALDFMFNKMARYQALYSRMYARCGYYQLGGAWGFRDQLQDCLCVMYGKPDYCKAHILRCCSYQYEEGDVMHWFHESTKMGIRSRYSDDLLWLVYTVYEYVKLTGDTALLFEKASYLHSEPLSDGEHDRYEKAVASEISESVYGHCIKALEFSMQTGIHGLCLMRGGDWNDGMNGIGADGKAESVWLSMFMRICCLYGAELAKMCKDEVTRQRLLSFADNIGEKSEQTEFNGYYIRGYDGEGKPFGSPEGRVCRIDSLPQAFAALCPINKNKAKTAIITAYEELYDRENKIFRLLSPPVTDKSAGYIADYPPGIRENGGQYTHAGVWFAMGLFSLSENEKGYELMNALNPLSRCKDSALSRMFEGEEYVIPADISTNHGVYGRCGWSWYTGSAGWYFTAVLRYLLGYSEENNSFVLRPGFCPSFTRFTLKICRNNTKYTVTASKTGVERAILDGTEYKKPCFPLDGGEHSLNIEF